MMTETAQLAAGFLGGGFMAGVHTRAARAAGATLTALASSRLDRAVAAADKLAVRDAKQDAEAVFAVSDVVHICTPNGEHAPQALAAIAAGTHVICEKPLATTVGDAAELVHALDGAGLVGAVPFVYRYHPMVRRARRLVAGGTVGTVLTVQGSYLQDWMAQDSSTNWRADGVLGGASRAFADIGSHLCDLLEFVVGARICTLSARTRTVYGDRGGLAVANEDIAALAVEFDNGALGSLLVSQLAPGRKNALTFEVHGTERSVRFEQEEPEKLWVGSQDGSQLLLREPTSDGDDGLSFLPSGHPMGYQDAFNAFVADVYAVIGGEIRPEMPTFIDGLRAALVTAAVLESASNGGRWITVAAGSLSTDGAEARVG